MKSFSLLIFDCDGVLIESERLANEVEVQALQSMGHDITLDEYMDLALGRQNELVAKLLAEEKRIHLPENFWEEMAVELAATFEKELQPVRGVREVLQMLSLPKCVASSSTVERLKHTLQITGLLEFFPEAVFSTQFVKEGKPAPDIYLYAAQKMGIPPAECLVIEDSLAGVEAGLRAGMEVWGFCGAQHITSKRRQFIEKSGVTHVFEDMHDLLDLLLTPR